MDVNIHYEDCIHAALYSSASFVDVSTGGLDPLQWRAQNENDKINIVLVLRVLFCLLCVLAVIAIICKVHASIPTRHHSFT